MYVTLAHAQAVPTVLSAMKQNAIAQLQAENPSIRAIIFNGLLAQKLFPRLLKQIEGVEFKRIKFKTVKTQQTPISVS